MKNSTSICLGLSCVFFCSVQICHSYEYHPTRETEKIPDAADREISCAGLDAIDIGVERADDDSSKSSDPAKKTHVSSRYMFFTREQIARFLKTEKHKNMLLVHVLKFRTSQPFDLTKFSPFLESLGYKRILVLEDRAFFPIPVLLDETLTDPNIEKKEHVRAAQDQADAVVKTNPVQSVASFAKPQSGISLEPRFYALKNHPAECAEIDEFFHNADKRVEVNKDLSLTICDMEHGGKQLPNAEIFKILKEQPQRNSLSIFFQSPYGVMIPAPSMEVYADGCKQRVREMKPSLDELGYKRIVIYTLDPHHLNPTNGYYLLADFRY